MKERIESSDEQQQTEDECRKIAGDLDRIQTTACRSRHQRVPAAVCQHSVFHHSVQSRCSSHLRELSTEGGKNRDGLAMRSHPKPSLHNITLH